MNLNQNQTLKMNLTVRIFFVTALLTFFWLAGTSNSRISTGKSVNLQEFEIEFSSGEMTLKQFLDELIRHHELTVVYGNKDLQLDSRIKLSAKKLTVKKALEEVERQAPVEFIFNNSHIIVKKRKQLESYWLKGTVKDSKTGESLSAAYVYVVESGRGTISDSKGNYALNLAPGSYRLACRFVGYHEKIIPIEFYEDTIVDFSLKVKEHEINQVDVDGSYSELNVLEKGRPIETIDSRTIDRLNTNDVNDALHGRINGVWTTKVSGAPGDHNKVRIRGISSIFGSTDPLYVVDGMIVPIVNFKTLGISDLNTHDVESITVLKDASSTALYGYQGGNGVIIIETKRGGGKKQLNFSVKKGVQSFNKFYKLMDSEMFLNTLELSDANIRTKFYREKDYQRYPYYINDFGDTISSDNFQDEIFQLGQIEEYQLSGKGSFKGVDYYLSGNFYNHKGIVTNSNYKKYSFTANLSKNIGDKVAIRLLYKSGYQNNQNTLDNYMGNNVIFRGINFEPSFRYTPDTIFDTTSRLFYNDITNSSVKKLSDYKTSPDKIFYEQEKIKKEITNSINLMGFYRFNKQLSFRADYSFSKRDINFNSYIPYGKSELKYMNSNENVIVFSQQYTANFERKIKQNILNASVKYRNYIDNAYWLVDSTLNVNLDGITPEDDVYLRGSQAIYGEKGSVIRSINSLIFNANYNYKQKYFLSAIANFDYLKEGYYVNVNDQFLSVAVNWDLSEERIFHLPDWIDQFDISINWGQSGNYPLNSLSNDIYSVSTKYTANDSIKKAIYVTNIANHLLKHEEVTEMNYGTEISLLENRVVFSANYYQKTNSDLLVRRSIPYYYGGGEMYQNIGEMKNSGIELSLEFVPFKNASTYWSSRFGFSTNNQYITKLNEGETINFNNTDILFPDFVAKENEVLGSIYGYNSVGLWDDLNLSKEEIRARIYGEYYGMAYTKFDTLKHNLVEGDKTIIGNSIPDFTFNWLNIFEYKNFSCEMLWYGSIGVDKYNATKAATYIAGTNYDVRSIVMDSLRYMTSYPFYESSCFVEDASFIRLKTLRFTYRQNRKIASIIGLEYTLSFENLVTISNYSGYDPEATIYTNNNFSDNAIDMGAYPNPRGVYFSINMTF